MKWFMNIKIAAKLLSGFILVALIAGGIGVFGIYNLKHLDDMDTELYELNTVPLGTIGHIAIDFQLQRVAYRDMLIDIEDTTKQQTYNTRLKETDTNIRNGLKEFEKTISSPEIRTEYDSLVKVYDEYSLYRDEIATLLLAKNQLEGLAVMRGNGAVNSAQMVDTHLDKLVNIKIKDAGEKSASNTATANSVSTTMIIILVVGIILAIVLGVVLSNIISRPIKRLAAAADKLAVGDIEVDVSVKTKTNDELGTLMESFGKMVENVRDQVDATEKVAEGDLSVTVKVKSDKDILGKKLVEMLDTIKALVNDTDKLVVATQEGRLDKRGNAKAFTGGWGTLVGGINNLMDTLVGHLDAMPAPVMIIDKNFNINYMNKIGADILSTSQKQLIGTKCYDSFKTSDCKTQNCACAMSMQQGQKVSRETDAHPNGMNLDIAYTALPLKDADNQIIGVLELVVDQTAIKNAGRIAQKQAQYQDKETSKLLANIENLAQGKLQCHAKTEPTDDDTKLIGEMFGNIYNSFEESLNAMSSYVKETAQVLTEMSKGNLDLSITGEYKGDFVEIKSSVNLIIDSLNEVLSDMNNASGQVAAGSRQVSDSAQALSQGSTEQASSIEELTASMEEISTQTKLNATNATQANELALAAKEGAIKGNQQMQGMLKAMDEINESSGNISKIIKVIDEIAFQTNILALNAAVEAARAGQHGKGFAVVAEEVRNLAARSANAAKETTALIEGSIKKVEGGTKIASDTALALNQIVEGVTKATTLVGEIATASNEQALGINQVNQGILQVSDVVQTNSATSEESAAASEELSSQAELLREQVSRFKLKKTTGGSSYRGSDDLNPEVLRMLEEMSRKNKGNYSSVNQGYAEAAATSSKPKISLSDREFGKY